MLAKFAVKGMPFDVEVEIPLVVVNGF